MSIAINNREEDRDAASSSGRQDGARAQPVSGTTRVAFVVNGAFDSAMGHRARDLATRITGYDIRFAYRSSQKLVSVITFLLFLLRSRPTVIYVFDISYSGILAAAFYRIAFGNLLIVDTGDAITELARSSGSRGKLGIRLTQLLESFTLRIADRVVVRGSFHRDLLAQRRVFADVIQDGVDLGTFTREDARDLRKHQGLDGVLTLGLVGSSVWSEKLQMCYGWELVETMRLLKSKPVKGVIIGGGSGISHLKAQCRAYGIEDRILFLDHVPFADLPRYLKLIDVCLSTQTNDVVGQVRTTGKLPLYLAAGRHILASKVGEAALVLPKEMLVDYDGVKDLNYPAKLAARVDSILASPEVLSKAAGNVAIAREHFDYSLLAAKAERVIAETVKRKHP